MRSKRKKRIKMFTFPRTIHSTAEKCAVLLPLFLQVFAVVPSPTEDIIRGIPFVFVETLGLRHVCP